MAKQYSFWLIFFLNFMNFITFAQMADAYEAIEESHSTSVVGMIKLLKLEQKLVDNLESYANELELKLKTIRHELLKMQKVLETSRSNPEEYLSNPLNSFGLIQHMQADWSYWQRYMAEAVGEEQVYFMRHASQLLPTETDLFEATTAMHRLQFTYDLNAMYLANGRLNGIQYDAKLDISDCYEMAMFYFNVGNYYIASEWFETAIYKYSKGEHSAKNKAMGLTIERLHLLNAKTLLNLQRQADALQTIEDGLLHNPNDAHLMRMKYHLMLTMETQPLRPLAPAEKPVYEDMKGCRGQYEVKRDRHLRCVYNTTTTAFLTLAPLKMEQLSLDPYVVIYHDVLYDSEIAFLKAHSADHLYRAKTFNYSSGQAEKDDGRTTKNSWLPDVISPIIECLSQRVVDMTGLSLITAEVFNVMNYGLGGHYLTHSDFFNATDMYPISDGDRVATVLYYLNDVEQGGATVFDQLHLAIQPKKGSALYWRNLHNSGSPMHGVRHFACPVIVGSKWVMTRWINEGPQIFTSPCFNPYQINSEDDFYHKYVL